MSYNSTTQFYNEKIYIQTTLQPKYYQLRDSTNGGVTAMSTTGQDKEDTVIHSKAHTIEG